MQRWIVWGVVAMMLMLGGGVFAYSTYKQNRPHPMWIPLLLNPALPGEKRQEIAMRLMQDVWKFLGIKPPPPPKDEF